MSSLEIITHALDGRLQGWVSEADLSVESKFGTRDREQALMLSKQTNKIIPHHKENLFG